MSILKKFEETLRKENNIKPYESLLICVSGGQDSISLLFLLKTLQKTWQWRIGIVYCDHLIQSESSSAGVFLDKLAIHLNFEYYEILAQFDLKSESESRSWRYKKIFKLAYFHKYSKILTGHTKQDRTETFFLNLLRGSNLIGLNSLYKKVDLIKTISLIRPCLNFSRTEFWILTKYKQFPIRQDKTNKNLIFLRNKIRNEIFPYLKQNFNKNIETQISRLQDSISFQNELTERVFSNYSLGIKKEGEKIFFPIGDQLPIFFQRLLIGKFIKSFDLGERNFEKIERLRLFLMTKPKKEENYLKLGKNEIWIKKKVSYIEVTKKNSKKKTPKAYFWLTPEKKSFFDI